jgi:hypothetical protein
MLWMMLGASIVRQIYYGKQWGTTIHIILPVDDGIDTMVIVMVKVMSPN